MNKKIIFTGGGSAGHVTLNLALIPYFIDNGWQVVYIGSKTGIENDLVKKIEGVKYYAIETGKLRRYFSWQNFMDMLKIPVGIFQAIGIVLKEKPNIIFSKGGFVSFPVVLAGYVCRVKSVMHESDVTPGLANKMSLPFVSKFFTTFDDTAQYVKNKSKVDYIGPVLSDRFEGADKARGCRLCGFDENKPIVMFVGGSLGAKSLNDAVRANIAALLERYQIIHICGRGQVDPNINYQGYVQFDYVDKEFKDLMEASDVVVSRAGSNAIFELLNLHKPMVLVPLPSASSRG
ncbi:MAG: undecaprenyldiphospho-muramoylpentapeptide beta-N-acetylglucosaminyltransferase, partial [Alphaproteobacteria bacterium]|nr:undecaprenyldiphospho-muramoylpentapeptide beta-N-acetylglucosaminyltransferase [Alphaproteobacteria bacterium]